MVRAYSLGAGGRNLASLEPLKARTREERARLGERLNGDAWHAQANLRVLLERHLHDGGKLARAPADEHGVGDGQYRERFGGDTGDRMHVAAPECIRVLSDEPHAGRVALDRPYRPRSRDERRLDRHAPRAGADVPHGVGRGKAQLRERDGAHLLLGHGNVAADEELVGNARGSVRPAGTRGAGCARRVRRGRSRRGRRHAGRHLGACARARRRPGAACEIDKHHVQVVERLTCDFTCGRAGDALVGVRQALGHRHARVPEARLHKLARKPRGIFPARRDEEELTCALGLGHDVARHAVSAREAPILPWTREARGEIRR